MGKSNAICGYGAGTRLWFGAAGVAVFAFSAMNCRPGWAGNRVQIKQDTAAVSVLVGGQFRLRYRFARVPLKPYVERFLTPGGVNVLRDSPHDHKHHHALMFAVAVDGVNFWEERSVSGRETPRGAPQAVREDVLGFERATIQQTLDWTDPGSGRTLLWESRRIATYSGAGLGASLLTWESRLAVPKGRASATLSGSRYFGLGARFLPSMDDGGHFLNADGKTGVAGTNLVRSRWCAYQALADGKPVTFAMLDHPSNARFPATWYTMGDKPGEFAYMTNTLNLKKKPLTIAAGKPLDLRYGVALWDGRVDAQSIETLYRRWSAFPATGVVKREP